MQNRVKKTIETGFLLLIISFLWVACSSETKEESTESILTHFSEIPTGLPKDLAKLHQHSGGLLVSIPQSNPRRNKLLLVFGGMYYANPQYMLDNTPKELFDKIIIAFAPCRAVGGQGFELTIQSVEKILNKEGVSISEIAVCGFSGGGPDALEAHDQRINFIGLIDPNPQHPKRSAPLPKHLILSYNKDNWTNGTFDDGTTVFEGFDRLAEWTKQKGGKVEQSKVKHEWFPKYFLYKYRKKILS